MVAFLLFMAVPSDFCFIKKIYIGDLLFFHILRSLQMVWLVWKKEGIYNQTLMLDFTLCMTAPSTDYFI